MSYLMQAIVYLGWVLTLCMAVACWRQHQQIKDIKQQHKLDIDRLERALQRLNDVSLGMGQRMLQLEQKKQPATKSSQTLTETSEALGYSQAMHLLNNGVEASQVAASCGISQTEAQLMALIRSKKAAYEALKG